MGTATSFSHTSNFPPDPISPIEDLLGPHNVSIAFTHLPSPLLPSLPFTCKIQIVAGTWETVMEGKYLVMGVLVEVRDTPEKTT